MLKHEIEEAVKAIDIAVAAHKGMRMTRGHRTIIKGGELYDVPDHLHAHRLEQINRILRWACANWDEVEPQIYRWLYPERCKTDDDTADISSRIIRRFTPKR